MIEKKIEKIINEFNQFEDWEDKYAHLIKRGKSLPEMQEALKTEDNKVKGCQSQVWMSAILNDDHTLSFVADSDAMIVKGIVSMLVEVYSGEKPEVIISHKPEFIKEIGLDEHLSPSRTNGLFSMIKQIKYYATAYQALLSKSF
ncbi:MAG: SufE family protein [Bdellovibrionales bacterium]|nr:SufE family protein [Bdellovibrionales bacterium]